MPELRSSTTVHDVAIIGAGPAGSCAAYFLARQGLNVLLLDRRDFPRDKTCGDALTSRALAVLDGMGVLGQFWASAHSIDQLQLTGPGGGSVVAPTRASAGQIEPLVVVPRLALDEALRRRAVASGARFVGQCRVTDVESAASGVLVSGCSNGHAAAWRARLVLLAVGASTGLLSRLGLLRRPPHFALAARAYYEDVAGLANSAHLRFDGVSLPGYGWVFPLSGSSANVGVGYLPARRAGQRPPLEVRALFERFAGSPALDHLLARARRVGPIRSYPIRTDFGAAPTSGRRMLLVGEAAGLVNPLTGEGIGYALESGQLAAEHAGAMLASGGPSESGLAAYDGALRRRFGRRFVYYAWLRAICLNRPGLNAVVWLARHSAVFRARIVETVLDAAVPTAPDAGDVWREKTEARSEREKMNEGGLR
jgi:menaquinone-9 beta-reductase